MTTKNERYEGELPLGFIRIHPSNDLGQIILRANCIHSVLEGVEGAGLINLDGGAVVEFVTIVIGVMGGKKFQFKVSDSTEDILDQIHRASRYIVMDVEKVDDVVEDKYETDPEKVN